MEAGARLREARRRRGITQRELARLSGIAQPMIARIERGVGSPRIDTFDRLLSACDHEIEVRPRLGLGVDRSMFDVILALSPAERLRRAAAEAESLGRLQGAFRR